MTSAAMVAVLTVVVLVALAGFMALNEPRRRP